MDTAQDPLPPTPLTGWTSGHSGLREPWRDGWLRGWKWLSELSLRVTNPAYCQPDAPLSRFILRPRAACMENDEERGKRPQHGQSCVEVWKAVWCHYGWSLTNRPKSNEKSVFAIYAKRETHSISILYKTVKISPGKRFQTSFSQQLGARCTYTVQLVWISLCVSWRFCSIPKDFYRLLPQIKFFFHSTLAWEGWHSGVVVSTVASQQEGQLGPLYAQCSGFVQQPTDADAD